VLGCTGDRRGSGDVVQRELRTCSENKKKSLLEGQQDQGGARKIVINIQATIWKLKTVEGERSFEGKTKGEKEVVCGKSLCNGETIETKKTTRGGES